MYIGDLRQALEKFTSPGTTAFERVRRDTLEFVNTILPEWPIVSVDQVYNSFHAYHNRPVPDRTPESHIFWLVLSLGDLLCHIRHVNRYEMEKKFGSPMTDLFLLKQSTHIVTIQVQALEALRCRYAGHWKNTHLDDLVLSCLGDTDLFSPVVMWTYVNLLWDSPSSVPSKLNPMQLPFPSKDYFAGMFGEQSWNLFVAKCTNTVALYQIQGGASIMGVQFGDLSGLTLGGIKDTIPSLYAVHSATGDERPVDPSVYQVAQSCATNCELYLFTIQKLDHVHRLFMLWHEVCCLSRLCIAHESRMISTEHLLKHLENVLSFWKQDSVSKFVRFDVIVQWEGMRALLEERVNGS